MEESILITIKKMIGVRVDDDAFDVSIISHINTTLMTLNQLGVGPAGGFSISGTEQTWADLLGDATDLETAKTYVYLNVKMLFDPPPSSTTAEAYNRKSAEYEWRLQIQSETEVD